MFVFVRMMVYVQYWHFLFGLHVYDLTFREVEGLSEKDGKSVTSVQDRVKLLSIFKETSDQF